MSDDDDFQLWLKPEYDPHRNFGKLPDIAANVIQDTFRNSIIPQITSVRPMSKEEYDIHHAKWLKDIARIRRRNMLRRLAKRLGGVGLCLITLYLIWSYYYG